MSDPAPILFVVDDDESVRTALARLARSAGLAVRTFASAEEFLDSRLSSATGCLIIDLHMPGMNGLELQAKLLALGSALRMIFITAYEDPEAERKAVAAGAVAFLKKPFDDQLLLGLTGAAVGTTPMGIHIADATGMKRDSEERARL